MLHNEDPGQDNTYLFGQSELKRYWTGGQYGGHRAAGLRSPGYSIADVVYGGHRAAPYAYEVQAELQGVYGADDGIAGYRTFGSGVARNNRIPQYAVRGLSQSDWCASTLFTQAQAQLCHLSSTFCAGGPNGNCGAITSHIQSDCTIFTRDNGLSDQIRTACQCVNGTWVGQCQGSLPCSGQPPPPPPGGGIDTTTLLLIGGGVAVGLVGLFLLTDQNRGG